MPVTPLRISGVMGLPLTMPFARPTAFVNDCPAVRCASGDAEPAPVVRFFAFRAAFSRAFSAGAFGSAFPPGSGTSEPFESGSRPWPISAFVCDATIC
jgi:hypothetical protein